MTVSAETSKVVYVGNGIADTFAYTFKVFAETELKVTRILIATGEETVLVLNTDYTVTGVGLDAGGNVKLTAGALAATNKLVVQRSLSFLQQVDYRQADKFPAETHEQALDRLTMICQVLKELVDRAVKLAADQTTGPTFPSPSANKIIGWNSAGNALENKDVSGVSAYSFVTKTATGSIALGEEAVKGDATAGSITLTLPTAASANGRKYHIKKIDASANTVTVQGNGAETMDGSNTKVLSFQYQAITMISDGTSWKIFA